MSTGTAHFAFLDPGPQSLAPVLFPIPCLTVIQITVSANSPIFRV